ncbi:hydantoinase B/oxoprolinase family protein [Komagataeibacter nataicola]|nr:hydantoinase B/oxoprolinase family protein [Komagataeibacter nataicola]WNM08870.1 hydantoinase B/oxoprolinase family protein [Komagataeibacter nataicola]
MEKFFAYPGSIGVSGFVGLDCMPAIREAGTLAEGDVLITNDPYHSQGLATHLPDLHVIAPVFHDGRIIAYLWAFVHCSDIGGRVPSSVSTTNTEIYQEGLQIPPLRLVKKGRIDNEIERLIRVNSRTPDNNMGDIQAMLAAIGLGQRRVATLVQRHGIATFLAAQKDLCAYTARRARAAIEKIPDGSWAFSDYLDSDMVSGLPVRFAVKVVVDRGRITLDFTGTDPQVHAAMNIPSAGKVHPWLTLRIMALVVTLDPGIPLNAGLQFPIEMIAPRGSVVHPVRPAAVGVRHAACVRVNDVLNGALGIALPEVMTAANSGVIIPVVAAEPAGDGERNVQVVEPMTGGTGARHGMDGTDGRDPSISNLANNPVEMVESELGVRILHYGLRAGSGGPGNGVAAWGWNLCFVSVWMIRSYSPVGSSACASGHGACRKEAPVS